MEKALPSIPAKRYFTIGEVSDLCGVKPYVLRYWEQEFTQLKPMKRRGNRRYYQHHEVLLIRRIRELLYEQGFTISGARNRLTDGAGHRLDGGLSDDLPDDLTRDAHRALEVIVVAPVDLGTVQADPPPTSLSITDSQAIPVVLSMPQMRQELISIRHLLAV
ncbi:hypothetical protein BH11PSE8_BH11PSE8_38560 [soil metagenome]